LNKLEIQNKKCDELLFSKNNNGQSQYDKCITKYNLDKKNTKINKCLKKKCQHLTKMIDKLNSKLFQLKYNKK
jgi:hypothetical protein